MSTTTLSISHLTVRRSRGFVLRIGKLQLQGGETLCLVGANGSGKTTLIETVVGLSSPDSGSVTICGRRQSIDSPEIQEQVGYIPDDENWIIPELTAREYLALLSELRKYPRNRLPTTVLDLADQLSFSDFNRQMRHLSHGNRKKVQIIAALFHCPRLLVVDELRNGLDPLSIRTAEQLVRKMAMAGSAILAATHDLWWAERMADRVLMLKNGSAVLDEPVGRACQQAGSLEARLLQLYAATSR